MSSLKSLKPWMKRAIETLLRCLLAPMGAVYLIGAVTFGHERIFAGCSQAFSLLPGLIGESVRRAFYWWVLPQVGEDVCIGFGAVFSHSTARLGGKVYVGCYCVLGAVTLEDDVLLGSGVSIMNGSRQHGIERLDVPVREQPGEWPHITIGRDTWIGDRAIIMANIGRHCVIGAGAVVTKPIPDYAIAVGNPARIVRFRTSDELNAHQTLSHPEVEYAAAHSV